MSNEYQSAQYQSAPGDFVQDLGSAVRENPLSAALIGMGLVWLFTGAENPFVSAQKLARRTGIDRFPDVAADAYNSGRDAISSGIDAVTEGASTLASRASDRVQALGSMASSAVDAVGDIRNVTAQGASERGGEMVASLKDNLTDLFERQPLLLGAVGLAIGAGIAASLPSTDFEADLLGETSDEFRQTASRFISEQKENVSGIASGIATAATEEAKAQGLTVDGLQDAASGTLHKLQNVATAASDSVKDRIGGGSKAASGKPN
jgi:hypothetical protein